MYKKTTVPLVEFMYLVFTCMPGESYRRRLRSLSLYLCYILWVLINSLVFWFCSVYTFYFVPVNTAYDISWVQFTFKIPTNHVSAPLALLRIDAARITITVVRLPATADADSAGRPQCALELHHSFQFHSVGWVVLQDQLRHPLGYLTRW